MIARQLGLRNLGGIIILDFIDYGARTIRPPCSPNCTSSSHATAGELLLDEEGQHLAGLSEFIGKPISLQAESMGSPENYDIVLR